MICVRCENEDFVLKPDTTLQQEFRGEALKVVAPAMACAKCGWVTFGPGQVDDLRKRTADVYRERHGLLTSVAIKNYREALGMSQRDFASFLKVGEASVKRWETWQVQDQSSNELIRLKCQLAKLFTPRAATWKVERRTSDSVREFVLTVANQKTVGLPRSHFHNWVKIIPAQRGTWHGCVGNQQGAYAGRVIINEGKQEWCALPAVSTPTKRRQQQAKRKSERKGVDYYDPALALAA